MTTTKKKIYLSGAIESAPDHGKRWRTILSKELNHLGYDVFNPQPLEESQWVLEFLGWKKFDFKKLKTREFRQDYYSLMRKIVLLDTTELLKCNYVVAYLDQYGLKSTGTHGELTLASHNNIPVYSVKARNVKFESIPAWIIGCTEEIFNSFKDLKAFLRVSTALCK